ncbi:translation initiation factor IF-2-like [Ornithorhynchus anatinus]|uniref:translation initiation factor IF-2-like n=1 Tax=Ornithorhynchus anatinus TaxID=9258 RepID=UPI0019D46E75|nr:translation initiation factor IF-2-like [Ornithorhynchus anatinus]
MGERAGTLGGRLSRLFSRSEANPAAPAGRERGRTRGRKEPEQSRSLDRPKQRNLVPRRGQSCPDLPGSSRKAGKRSRSEADLRRRSLSRWLASLWHLAAPRSPSKPAQPLGRLQRPAVGSTSDLASHARCAPRDHPAPESPTSPEVEGRPVLGSARGTAGPLGGAGVGDSRAGPGSRAARLLPGDSAPSRGALPPPGAPAGARAGARTGARRVRTGARSGRGLGPGTPEQPVLPSPRQSAVSVEAFSSPLTPGLGLEPSGLPPSRSLKTVGRPEAGPTGAPCPAPSGAGGLVGLVTRRG